MVKKNLSIILVILFTLLLIAIVIWVFDKRIESIGKGMYPTTSYFNGKRLDSLFKETLLLIF